MVKLREGLPYGHWLGSRHYVGRKHAGGAVMTGPMPLEYALNLALDIQRAGNQAEVAEETSTRAAWFVIINKLYSYPP